MAPIRFFFLILLVLALGCKGDPAATNASAAESVETEDDSASAEAEPETVILIPNVDQLLVREVPDKKGKVVGRLRWGQEIVSLEEESDFKEKITLREMVRYDSWRKVRVPATGAEPSFEGWVFGGALRTKSNLYEKDTEGNYSRTVIRASREELIQLLGIEIEDDYFFDGKIGYRKTDAGDFVKHGKFSIEGGVSEKVAKEFGFRVSVEFKGNYKDGEPHGVFERKLNGYENNSFTTVSYENGKCLWSAIMGSGEGEDYNHREENPKDCSFRYIERRLVQRYNR